MDLRALLGCQGGCREDEERTCLLVFGTVGTVDCRVSYMGPPFGVEGCCDGVLCSLKHSVDVFLCCCGLQGGCGVRHLASTLQAGNQVLAGREVAERGEATVELLDEGLEDFRKAEVRDEQGRASEE